MPVLVQGAGSALRLSFHRDGREIDRRIAPDGLRAVRLAMQLIAIRDQLIDGDKLLVEIADGEAPPISPE